MTPNDIVQLLAATATAAHQAGYEAGVHAAQDQAAANVKEDASEAQAREQFLYNQARAEGLDQGYTDGFQDGAESSAYDDGYIDGVSDARVCPADADARVAELCGDDLSAYDFEDYDPSDFSDYYETDGDYYTRQYAEQEAELAERCIRCGSRGVEAFCAHC